MSNNKLYLHNIDLNKNQIVNPVLHNATTPPSTPVDGQMYYNTTEKAVYYYNNTEWKKLGGITGGTTNYVVKYSAADAITAGIIYDDGTNIGIGTTSPTAKVHVLGNAYFEDTTTRSNITTGVRGTNFKFNNIISSTVNSGVVPFGPHMQMLYQFSGSIGTTVWGNNIFWPQRRVIDINSSMNLNNATYVLNGNNNFPNAALAYAINLGSNDNSTTVPLDITVGSGIETGMIGSLARMDFFPNNDSGASIKYFKGIYSTYVSFFDLKAAAGSTHDTIIHFAGGSYRHLGGVQVDTMIGVYVTSMKNSSTGQFISNSYAFSQDGPNDKNFFAGGAILGSLVSSSGSALLQINSTTKGFLFPRMTLAQRDLIYKDTLAIAIDTPGSGYVNGTYTKRYVSPNTTTNGVGMTVNVTVAGGVVTDVQLVVPGTNYAVNDLLTVTKEQLGSPSGAGFKFKVVSLVDYPTGLTIYQTDNTEGLYTRRAGSTASWERYITTYDLSSTTLLLNSSSGGTFVGYSSEPGTAGTYKFGVNGTIQYTGNLISSGSGGNYTLSLRSGATANDFGRIVAYTNGSSLTEMQSLEFGYYKTNLNSNYEFSNTNYNEWGFRVYGTITGTATGGGVYSSLLINPTLNITGNTNTSTYYGIRIAATETSTINTTVIPFSYTHIGATFTASNVIVNNSKIVKFTNSGASGNWGGGFGFYGGSNGNNGILALRVYSSGTADSNNAVMIGDVAEAGVQGSSIRFVVKSRVASGSESSYDDVQVIYTDSNAYAITGSKILNALVFGVGNASNLPSSTINGTYAVALGFQIDPLTNGWGTSLIISGKNDSGVMAEIARFTGKNKNLLVGTTTDSGSYKIEAAGLIRGTGLHSTTGNLVIGTELNYSSFQGVSNEGAVQVIGTSAGTSTKMIFRPYGNASGYTSNYWGTIEQNGTAFNISSGNYHYLNLKSGNSKLIIGSVDNTYNGNFYRVLLADNTALASNEVSSVAITYSTITTDILFGTLLPSTTYYYRIVACDENEIQCGISSELSITIPAGSAVNRVIISGITFTAGLMRWYKVYRGTTSGVYTYRTSVNAGPIFYDNGFTSSPGTYAPQSLASAIGSYTGITSDGYLYAKNFWGRQITFNKRANYNGRGGLYVVNLGNSFSIPEVNMGSGTNYIFGEMDTNTVSTWTNTNIVVGQTYGASGYSVMDNTIALGTGLAYAGGTKTYSNSVVIGYALGYGTTGTGNVSYSTIIQVGTASLWSSLGNEGAANKSISKSFIWRGAYPTGDYRADSFADSVANVFMIGSGQTPIYDVWFGNGGIGIGDRPNYSIHGSEIVCNPNAYTIANDPTSLAFFTNTSGGSIILAGGRGRGTGTGGDVILQTSSPAASGTTLQTLTSRWYIKYNTGTLSNVASPSASAALQIDSITRGFLPPRMTTTDRNSISSPAVGLSIYNTTTNKMETWDGTVWNAHW